MSRASWFAVKGRRARAGVWLCFAVAIALVAVINGTLEAVVFALVYLVAAAAEWLLAPLARPLHPPQESTLQWLRSRRKRAM
jgi:hypothetical protein